jgi:nitrogen regulatory protein PII
VVPNEQLEPAIAAILEHARTNQIGDGKLFVSELTDVIRVRTGEHGSEAI